MSSDLTKVRVWNVARRRAPDTVGRASCGGEILERLSDSKAVGEFKLLAIGDVHLGTRPSSLPADLADFGVEPRALTPESALALAVKRAVLERVDAVLFAGDVVESTNARFEALRPLESAVRDLLQAGIAVLGVVGNHDVEALPRLARMIEGFELVGEGGQWQSRVLEKSGRPAVEILGWCFPEKKVRSSPVADLLRNPIAPAHAGVPRIGLLHGDLDASGGVYAPFTRRELADAGMDAWLLGHIHKPSLTPGSDHDGKGPVGYLGSLVGLDPGEMGQHGPWLVRVTAEGAVVPSHLPIAPLHWDQFELRVGEDEEAEDVGDRLIEEAGNFASEIHAHLASSGTPPLALGLRVRLVGPSRHYEALRKCIGDGRWKGLPRKVGETLVFIDKVLDGLSLALDLEEVARGDDPPAILARKLLLLDRPGLERNALLEAARSELNTLAGTARWSVLEEERDFADPLEDQALATMLTETGTEALHDLLVQRDVGVVETPGISHAAGTGRSAHASRTPDSRRDS